MQTATALWRICINNSSCFASFTKEGGAQRTIVRGALRVEATGHVSGDGWARGGGTQECWQRQPAAIGSGGLLSPAVQVILHWLRDPPDTRD